MQSKKGRRIWTAPAETPQVDAGVIDLFAPDDPPAPFSREAGEAAPDASLETPTQEAPDDGVQAEPIAGEEPAAEEIEFGLLSEEEREEMGRRARARARSLGLCCLLLLFIALAAFVWFAFRVENMQVEGNEQLSAQAVIQRAGVKPGTHMLALRARACEEALRMDPYVATAAVKREYPNTLRITIRERKEAAVIVGMNAVAIIDADGYVLSIGERESYAGLVKIYGAGSSGYKVNGHVGDATDSTSRPMA